MPNIANPTEVFFSDWWKKCQEYLNADSRFTLNLSLLEQGLRNNLKIENNPVHIDLDLINMASNFLESARDQLSSANYDAITDAMTRSFKIGESRETKFKSKTWPDYRDIPNLKRIPPINITETPRGQKK